MLHPDEMLDSGIYYLEFHNRQISYHYLNPVTDLSIKKKKKERKPIILYLSLIVMWYILNAHLE